MRRRLKTTYASGTKITDSLTQLYAPNPPDAPEIEVIFFHGLQLESNANPHLSTWRCGDGSQELWPRCWLPQDYPKARILVASYDSCIHTTATEGRMDLYLIGEALLTEIGLPWGEQRRNCPLILVGHSFGGLVIKQLCLLAEGRKDNDEVFSFLRRVRGIFFYATPHSGMNEKLFSEQVMGSAPANERLLAFAKVLSASCARLHEDFNRVRRKYEWTIYGLGETQVSGEIFNVQVVEEASSRFGDEFFMVNCDHFSICRPESKECSSYQHIVTLLRTVYTSEKERKTKGKTGGIVGVEPLVSSIVEQHLQQHKFLGLCGMGGVGKTTLAKLVFERLEDTFDYTCFVENFKLMSGHKDEVKERIWKETRRYGKPISAGSRSSEVVGKKLLMVLDDISCHDHVDVLVEIVKANAMEESRYIVTSRNKELLRRLETHGSIYMCEVPHLRHEDAMALFLSYAFPGGKKPAGSLEATVGEIVERCDGLPLTLEVLGTYLRTVEDKRIWEDIPDVLRAAESISCLEERVWAKLRVSYDALHPDEKEMFVDVACIFSLDDSTFKYEDVKWAWSTMYTGASIKWQALVDKCLVTEVKKYPREQKYVSGYLRDTFRILEKASARERKFWMHEHLRSMGQKIARDLGRSDIRIIHDSHVPVEKCLDIIPRDEVLHRRIASCSLRYASGYDPCTAFSVEEALPEMSGVRYLDICFNRPGPGQDLVVPRTCFLNGGLSLPRNVVILSLSGISWFFKFKPEGLRKVAVLSLEIHDKVESELLSAPVWENLRALRSLSLTTGTFSQGPLPGLQLPRSIGCLSTLEELHLSQLISLPETVGRLLRLRILELCHLRSKDLPKSFGDLRGLEWLRMDSCIELQLLPENFGNVTKLEWLEITELPTLRQLPMSFGNLRSLKYLRLERTELRTLPESFGNLSQLKNLEMNRSKFTHLPESFGNLNGLQHLEMIRLELTHLPESFGNLSGLQHLEMDRLKLTHLPESFGNLSGLQHLEMNWLKLTHLPESFGNLSGLQHLEMNELKLTHLPESFGNLSGLQHLEMNELKLTYLPESSGNLSGLQHLKMNRLKLAHLPESFGNLSGLPHLEMNVLELTHLPESFGNLSGLQHLKMNGVKLTHLPESFGNLSGLEHLKMNWLKLTHLPESFGNLSGLPHLEMNVLELTHLPESFGNLSRLQHLKMDRLELTYLPESFGNFSGLQHLEMDRLKLMHLPESFENLSGLQHLEMDRLELMHLPESFGNLSGLQHLEMDRLKLTHLPESFGNLSGLQHLEMNELKLTHLPESFGNLSGLQHLEMRRMKLMHLPESFGNLSGLQHLEMKGLKLMHLPESFGNLSGLQHLEMNRVELTHLPESFENLSGLQHLEMNGVDLTHLPESFGNLNGLQHLKMNWLKLTHLPESFGNLSGLQHLEMNGLELTHLPESFGNLNGLQHLRMHGFKFTHLLESFVNLSGLQKLEWVAAFEDDLVTWGI